MDRLRGHMRGADRLRLRDTIVTSEETKADTNLTKGIDADIEDLLISGLLRKLPKMIGVDSLAIFSEERGISCLPEGSDPDQAAWVAFVDPVDGTEFVEHLQGGWCLLALYNRADNRVEVAVAGDAFLNRLYWASRSGPPEGLDFVTHSWFKLDGGPAPRKKVAGCRINILTTKVDRFLAVSNQRRLLDKLACEDGRINLAWGSNAIIQVAAGYADAAVEFCKGFAAYDLLPGLFIAEQAGLTVLDTTGRPLVSTVDVPEIFAAWRTDPKTPKRTKFVVAKEEELAHEIVSLLD